MEDLGLAVYLVIQYSTGLVMLVEDLDVVVDVLEFQEFQEADYLSGVSSVALPVILAMLPLTEIWRERRKKEKMNTPSWFQDSSPS